VIPSGEKEAMMRKLKALDLAIITLAVLSLTALLVTAIIKRNDAKTEARREVVIDQIQVRVADGEKTVEVDPLALTVPGEEDIFEMGYEIPQGQETAPTESISNANSGGATSKSTVTLVAAGTLYIPSINLDLPIWEGAEKTQLRYGIGQLSGSARPTESGNCVLLGHRMRTKGSLFNRLSEVKVGDQITLKNVEGVEKTYTVSSTQTVTPEDMYAFMYNTGEGDTVTLVSCSASGDKRVVVVASLT